MSDMKASTAEIGSLFRSCFGDAAVDRLFAILDAPPSERRPNADADEAGGNKLTSSAPEL